MRERDRAMFPRGERLRSKLKSKKKVVTTAHRVFASVCNGEKFDFIPDWLAAYVYVPTL